jgi:hypothetical protein
LPTFLVKDPGVAPVVSEGLSIPLLKDGFLEYEASSEIVDFWKSLNQKEKDRLQNESLSQHKDLRVVLETERLSKPSTSKIAQLFGGKKELRISIEEKAIKVEGKPAKTILQKSDDTLRSLSGGIQDSRRRLNDQFKSDVGTINKANNLTLILAIVSIVLFAIAVALLIAGKISEAEVSAIAAGFVQIFNAIISGLAKNANKRIGDFQTKDLELQGRKFDIDRAFEACGKIDDPIERNKCLSDIAKKLIQ